MAAPRASRWRLSLGLVLAVSASACEVDGTLPVTATGVAGATPRGADAASSSGSNAVGSVSAGQTVTQSGAIAIPSPNRLPSPPTQAVATPEPSPLPIPFTQPFASPTPSPGIQVIGFPSVAPPTVAPSLDPNCINGRATAVVPTIVAPGTLFYVKGTGFKGDVPVTIGGVPATVLRIESDRLTVRVPSDMPVGSATVPVIVKTCDAPLQADVTVALTSDFSGNVTVVNQGLLASIYPLATGTAALPDQSTRTPTNTFLCSQFNMWPRHFSVGFPGVGAAVVEWFAVRFEGKLILPTGGLHTLRLESDDGSRLYLDGNLLIDNDGLHAARSVSVDVPITAGPHDLRIDYFQGPGTAMALQLFWRTASPVRGVPVEPEELVPLSAFSVPDNLAR
ncbi:MAG: PA14 domain-containing protein [Candidatus Sericytochromatia bacterium]